MKKKKVKAKIIFAVCLVLFAAALIAALIVIDNANGEQPSGGGSGSSLGSGISLPVQDMSDLLQ